MLLSYPMFEWTFITCCFFFNTPNSRFSRLQGIESCEVWDLQYGTCLVKRFLLEEVDSLCIGRSLHKKMSKNNPLSHLVLLAPCVQPGTAPVLCATFCHRQEVIVFFSSFFFLNFPLTRFTCPGNATITV